jgi:hypothetical protein
MKMNQSKRRMAQGGNPDIRCSWEYMRNKPHMNNEEKWRLKCLKIPI